MSHFFEKAWDTLSLCRLFYSRITAYRNNAICYMWPNDVMFTSHIFEWQIQQIFDYSRFSVKGSQHFEKRFFKLSFHIFFIWNYQLFYFYIVKYYCEILYACVSERNQQEFIQSISGTSILGPQVQSNKEALKLIINMSFTATYY